MKTASQGYMLLLLNVLITGGTKGEYAARFDVLGGSSAGGESRHQGLLNTALLARQHTELSGAVAVFPGLHFSCSGVIHRVYLLGREGNGSDSPNLTFWQSGALFPQFRHSTPLTDLRRVVYNSATGVGLYETTIEAEFVSGDMIGFSQAEANVSSFVLKYQDMSERTLVIDGGILPGEKRLFPLIAIDSSNPECTSVFSSRESLERAVMLYLAIGDRGRLEENSARLTRNQQLLFPDLRFTCSATVSSLIVGADIAGGLSAVPEIQVWRLNEGSSDAYSKVDSVVLSNSFIQSVSVGLAVYRLETTLSVMAGDILGIFYPQQSNLLLPSLTDHGSVVLRRDVEDFLPPDSFLGDSSTVSSRREWPLVAVSKGDSGCVEGFMSHDLLSLLVERRKLTHLSATSSDVADVFVFPGLKFTTGGQLHKWIFVSGEDSFLRRDFPHFRVWRSIGQEFVAVNGTYTMGRTPARSTNLNVYEYTLDPPVQVMEGDFIGWEQTSASRTRFLPLLLNNTGYELHTATHTIGNRILETQLREYKCDPLIGIQFLEEVVPSSTVVMDVESTAVPTTTELPTEETDGGIQEVLATVLGSGLVGLIILLGLVLMFFFVMWAFQRHRKKGRRDIVAERTLQNPLYSKSQDLAGSRDHELQNGIEESIKSTSTLPPGASPAPPYAAPPIPTIRKDGSVQYDEPITTTKTLPPVAPKPHRPTLFPLYHTLDPQSSPYATPQSSPTNFEKPASPSSPKYHSLEPNAPHSPLLSPRSSPCTSPQFPATFSSRSHGPTSSLDRRTSPSLSPFASLDRRRPAHAREFSTSSERQLIHSPHYDPGYDIIQPPRWERMVSTTSSIHSHTHSRTSSRATLCDEEPTERVYHELTQEGGYSRLYRGGLFVPTKEERDRAVTTANRKKINIYAALSEFSDKLEENDLTFFEESDTYWRPAGDSTALYDQLAQRKYREIMRNQIKMQHVLGSGNFGKVSKGQWECGEGPVEVAVKTLKSGSSEEEAVRFLQEAAIMGQFRHPNIVQLLGVVTLTEPVMIILELLSLGDLRNHLLSLRPLTPGDAVAEGTEERLLGFCRDIASGMEYLERKMFVHRDLAARNILVDNNNSCKIGDFGMARDLENEQYYISRGGKIPIRWSPPEALNFKKYTTASDVWSFGIVMYEIWSLGHKPYEGYTNPQIQSLVERGERLAPPPGCPRPLYTLVINCWHPEHSCRPTFLNLLKTLSRGSSELLVWSEADAVQESGLARTLGAPLEAGKNLYLELQLAYTYV